MRLWIGLACAALPVLVAAQQQPPAVFRSGVDVITVDVRVVDRNGEPLRDLALADFTVTVDGKPRRPVLAEFISQEPEPQTTPSDPASPTVRTQSRGRSAPQTILIVFDESNIRSGEAGPAAVAATALLDRASKSDRIGLLTIPHGSTRVEPTTDRAAVKQALQRIVGHLVPVETRIAQERTLGVSEAFTLFYDKRRWSDIIVRECVEKSGGDQSDPQNLDKPMPECVIELEHVARSLTADVRERMLVSTRSIASLVQGMAAVPGPKTIVLLSQELPVPDWMEERRTFDAETANLVRAAALAQTGVYVLHLDTQLYDVEQRLMRPTATEDAEAAGFGLETVTSVTGGRRMMVAGRPERAFERIARELSGLYIVGFEAEAKDRDGKPHSVQVKVDRRGADVRARREFSFGEGGQKALAAILAGTDTGTSANPPAGGSGSAMVGAPDVLEQRALSGQYWSMVQDYRRGDAMTALDKVRELGEVLGRRSVAAIRGELRTGDLARWSAPNVRAAALFHLELVVRDIENLPWTKTGHLVQSRQLVAIAKDLERSGEPATFRKQWRLAVVWLAQGRLELEEAASELQWLHDEFPDDPEVWLTDGAIHEAYTWSKLEQSLPRPLLQGLISLDIRRHAANAEAAYRRVLGLQPGNTEARLRLGYLLSQQRKDADAARELALVLRGTKDPWEAYLASLFLGDLAERAGNPKAALDHYRNAQAARPQALTARIALSHALRRSGDRGMALKTAIGIEEATGDDPWWEYYFGQRRRLPQLIESMRREVMR